jgi:hypothetical protein
VLTPTILPYFIQGRIKGFVCSKHFSSLGSLGESKIIVATNGGRRDARIIVKHQQSEVYIFSPTASLARHRLRNVLFSHSSHFTGRITVDLLKKNYTFEVLYFIVFYFIFLFLISLFFSPFHSFVGPRHSAYSAKWVIRA